MERLRVGLGSVVYLVAFLGFAGYCFLQSYYSIFGYSIQELDILPQHFLLRAIDIVVRDWPLIGLLVTGAVAIQLASTINGVRLFVAVRSDIIQFCVFLIVFLLCYHRVIYLAEDYALRDMNAETSGLRQLVCGVSTVDEIDGLFRVLEEDDSRTLVLRNSEDVLILFREPEFPDANPRPTVIEVDASAVDYVLHAPTVHGALGVRVGQPCRR